MQKRFCKPKINISQQPLKKIIQGFKQVLRDRCDLWSDRNTINNTAQIFPRSYNQYFFWHNNQAKIW